jgi:hypothetical protein
MLVAFAKRDELDDIWVIGSSHDLNLLQNVGTLKKRKRAISMMANGATGGLMPRDQ